MARPHTNRRKQTVIAIATVGIPEDQIARCLGEDGIDPKTLRNYFRKESEMAWISANSAVGKTSYDQAIKGNTAAAIFWASENNWLTPQ